MSDPDELRRRMAEIRANLQSDARGIAENAREMVDWRCHVKNYPWACLGVAAALGYLAIPRRLETTSPDADTLAKLAKENRLVVQPRAEAQAKRSGIVGSLFFFASNVLLRAGLSYAGQQAGRFFSDKASEPNEPPPMEGQSGSTAVSGRAK